MSKYTPGPWKFELFDNDSDTNFVLSSVDVDAGPDGRPQDYGKSILEGMLVSESSDELDANARLIAAAPDLFEALMKIIEEFNPKRPEWHLMVSSEGQRMARTAIEKAIKG